MNHPEDVLEAMAREHIRYEFQMIDELAFSGHIRSDLATERARLESYLIHVRNLADFFRKRRGGKDGARPSDVIARDYFDRPDDWTPWVPPTALDLNQIHRRVAHISTQRLESNTTAGGFDWSVPARDTPMGDHGEWARVILEVRRDFYWSLKAKHPNRLLWFSGATLTNG